MDDRRWEPVPGKRDFLFLVLVKPGTFPRKRDWGYRENHSLVR